MTDPERIVTRCPTCGNQTLFIGEGGHLTCSWLTCPEPGIGRAIEVFKDRAAEADRLRGQIVAARRELNDIVSAPWTPIAT